MQQWNQYNNIHLIKLVNGDNNDDDDEYNDDYDEGNDNNDTVDDAAVGDGRKHNVFYMLHALYSKRYHWHHRRRIYSIGIAQCPHCTVVSKFCCLRKISFCSLMNIVFINPYFIRLNIYHNGYEHKYVIISWFMQNEVYNCLEDF